MLPEKIIVRAPFAKKERIAFTHWYTRILDGAVVIGVFYGSKFGPSGWVRPEYIKKEQGG